MEDFHYKYIADAKEMISSLIDEIIKLENSKESTSLIDDIFRKIHTLKGSAAMFGFEKVGKISHNLENIFEDIRSRQKVVNSSIIDISLSSFDIISKLLENNEQLSSIDDKLFNELIKKTSLTDISEVDEEIEPKTEVDILSNSDYHLFYILFYPNEDVLKRGIKPFDIFEELLEIGTYKAFPFTEKITNLDTLDVTDFFLYWEIFYVSKKELNDVKDIFMFYYDTEYEIIELSFKDFFYNQHLFNKFKIINSGQVSFVELQNSIREILKSLSVIIENIEQKNIEIEPSKSIQIETQSVESIRVSSTKLDELINLVSELVTLNSGLEIIAKQIGNDLLLKKLNEVTKLSKKFRDNALDLRLIPVSILIVKFKRLVRDLSLKLNKNIEFIVEGADTQLDKNIIDKIEAPLMHIIRNSIDHGIEDADERKLNNKPNEGIIRFIAFYSGANVFIQIQDDGKGIDLDRIKQKAIEKNLVTENSNLTEKELIEIIFTAGFSTAQSLTEVSGRGVGMDVVKKQIQDLRGEIDISTEKNLGTSVTLKLPLTLSIIDTLLVTVAKWQILLPLYPIVGCKRVKYDIALNNDQIEYNNQLIPLINMSNIFTSSQLNSEHQQIIFINLNEKYFGILIDKVISEHQAVIKPLGYLHQNQNYLSGVSILGNGTMALVIDLNALVKYYFKSV